jgi:hypothetical protein
MDGIVAANQIVTMSWLSPVLREKAWLYSTAANRKSHAAEAIDHIFAVLGLVPQYFRDSLAQATAEESAAKDLFVEAWKAERLQHGLHEDRH